MFAVPSINKFLHSNTDDPKSNALSDDGVNELPKDSDIVMLVAINDFKSFILNNLVVPESVPSSFSVPVMLESVEYVLILAIVVYFFFFVPLPCPPRFALTETNLFLVWS